MRPRGSASAIVTLVVTLAFAPAVLADTTVVDDAADSLRTVDIARVTASHPAAGRFSYRIDTHDPFGRRVAPCLLVRSGRPDPRTFRICGDGRLIDIRSGNTGRRARVSRPDASSIVFAFGGGTIGNPGWHAWRAIVRGNRCPGEVCDAAPGAGWVTHALDVTYERWAIRFADELDVPSCRNNRIVMLAWQANENTEAVFNPLATTRDMPGSWEFNSFGVSNFVTMAQGLDASRLTIENGYDIYGYGAIVRRLDRCAPPRQTAAAIRDSRWCFGCSGGAYVTGIVPHVEDDYASYAARSISTSP